uniref:Uncharacterized protein n=1 Tax=Helianthus annuus TaxID=4232 RepID=A0A251UGJ9_HELAN
MEEGSSTKKSEGSQDRGEMKSCQLTQAWMANMVRGSDEASMNMDAKDTQCVYLEIDQGREEQRV